MARSASLDPLEKYRFKVDWDTSTDGSSEPTALVRAGFHDIQMPKRTTTKIAYREGEDPDISMQAPGLSTMEDIVLSRGLISGGVNELYKWMSAVHKPTEDGLKARVSVSREDVKMASNSYKKTVTISMYDREGAIVRQWQLYQAFPVSFVSGSDLDASEDGDKSLEQLTLAYEDFREVTVGSSDPLALSASVFGV